MKPTHFVIAAAAAACMSVSSFTGHAAEAPAAAPSAALPAFEFRGHTVGENVLATYPELQPGQKRPRKPNCEPMPRGDSFECNDPSAYEKRDGYSMYYLGDIPPRWLHYLVYEGKFYGVDVNVHINWYTRFRNMLIGKYGPPTNEALASVQSGAGASLDNIVSEWKFKEGVLTLNQRAGTVDTTHLHFEADEVAAQIKAARAAREQAKGKAAL